MSRNVAYRPTLDGRQGAASPPDANAPATTPPPQRLTRVFTDDRPESLHYLEELRAVVDEYPDRVRAGEVQGKTDRIGHFYGNDCPRFHLPLNFALLDSEWDAIALQAHIDGARPQAHLGAKGAGREARTEPCGPARDLRAIPKIA